MASIGSLVINLEANVAQLSRDMSKATKILGTFEGSVKSIGRTIIGAAGFGSVTLAVRSMVGAVLEAEKASFKLDAVLKATGFSAGVTRAQIDKLANSMARSTLFDDEAVRNASAVFATFRNIQGATFTEGITLAADLSAVLGTDLQSSVTQLGKALNDPIAGITALGRAGVQFSAEQKDQIATMMKANDVLGAQNLILERVRSAFGGAAGGAAGGLAGAIHAVTFEWSELVETIGKKSIGTDWIKDFAEGIRALHEALDPSLATEIAMVEAKLEKLSRMPGMPWVAKATAENKLYLQGLIDLQEENFLGTIADQDAAAAKAIAAKATELAEAVRELAKAHNMEAAGWADVLPFIRESNELWNEMADNARRYTAELDSGGKFFDQQIEKATAIPTLSPEHVKAIADASVVDLGKITLPTMPDLKAPAVEFEEAAAVVIGAFGQMAAAAIAGSNQMSTVVISALASMAQAAVQMHAQALGSMVPFLGAAIGVISGIAMAVTSRSTPVHVASVSPEAASQMNGPRETKPQYVTLIFKDPSTGKVFEQFTVDANRATRRDAIDRVPAAALPW